jgi:flagellar hook protein FlgE
MSFNIGLTGIRAAGSDLQVTGNNIANASTTGFKRSRAEFGDIYASSMVGIAKNATGSGVMLADIAQQFTQGNIAFTDNVLDLSIDGSGFFIMSDGGDISYTRAGMFSTDSQGYVVNNAGFRLQGYGADGQGNILNGVVTDLHIDASNQAPRLTSSVASQFNLDATEVAPKRVTQGLEAADLADLTTLSAIQLHTSTGRHSLGGLLAGLTDTTPRGIADALNAKGKEMGFDIVATAGTDSISVSLGDGLLLSRDDGNGVVDAGEILPVSGHTAEFDPTNPDTYNSATSVTIYDSLGNPHVMTQYFVKQRTISADESRDSPSSIAATSNSWKMYAQIDGRDVGPMNATGEAEGFAMRFGSDGRLHPASEQAFVIDNWTPLDANGKYNGALGAAPGATIPLPTPSNSSNFVIDIAGSTQFGSSFGVNDVAQNGYATGRLSGVSIDSAGVVFARFTNGQAQVLGQVALASFNNEQGLQAQGGTLWTETYESGSPLVGEPQTAALGLIQSGALEESNVDLSEELVNLIIAQRNYQSNAKTIETADQVTQTILNI